MPGKTIRLLLVEDNPAHARLIEAMLVGAREISPELEHANRLDTALSRLEAETTDVVLLDLGLPDSQGIDTLTEICAHAPSVPVVVLTASDDETLGIQAMQQGAQDYMVKGKADRAMLVRALRYAVERKQYEQERVRLVAQEQAARAQAEQSHRRLLLLAEAGDMLTVSLDYQSTLTSLARLVLPGLADYCIVDTIENDQIRRLITAHVDPEKENLLRDLKRAYPPDWNSPHFSVRVLRSGQPFFYPEVTPETITDHSVDAEHAALLAKLAPRSMIGVPLVARGEIIGALSLAFSDSDRTYTADDLTFAQELARRAAQVIDNTRLYAQAEEQRTLLETILRQAADAVVVFGAQGEMLFVNAAARSLALLDPEGAQLDIGLSAWGKAYDAEGRPISTPKHPTTLALQGEVTTGKQAHMVRSDGSTYDILISAAPLKDSLGQIIGAVATFVDITDRIRAERVLERQSIALQSLHEVALDIGADLDVSSLFRRIVEHAARLLDADQGGELFLYDPEKDVLRLVAGIGLAETQVGAEIKPGEGLAGRIYQGQKPRVVNDYLAWEGRLPFLQDLPFTSVLEVPLFWRDQVLGVLGVNADQQRRTFDWNDVWLAEMLAAQAAMAITNASLHDQLQQHAMNLEDEVRQRVEEIRQHQERTEAILHNIGDAILIADSAGAITYTNRAFTELLGYEREEVIGERTPFVENGTTLPPMEHMLAAMRNRASWRGEITVHAKDGSPREMDVTIVPMFGFSGEIDHVIGSMRDIGQARQLDRMKTRFMQHISHELRTPLSSIRLYTQLLQSGRTPEKTGSYLETLEKETRRLVRLTEKVIDATRFTDSDALPEWEDIPVSRLLTEATARFQGAAETAGLALTSAPLAKGFPPVHGDQSWLSRALAELVENAIQFTPAGGRVHLAGRLLVEPGSKEAEVFLDVSDTGPGISAEDLALILENPLYRGGEVGQTGHIPGLGLGLTIARLIVERHGGRLEVQSAGEAGKGSIFSLVLPAAGKRDQRQEARRQVARV